MEELKVIKAQKLKVVAAAIMIFPRNMMISPTPPTMANLAGLDHAISKPSLAALQKFFPLRAIWMQACLLMNCTILSTQARKHLRQLVMYSTILLSPPAASACFLKTSTISCMNWMMARISDPKARLPRWYLKTILQLLRTGKLISWSGPWEQYQMQQADATTKVPAAWIKALHQRVPKMKAQNWLRLLLVQDQTLVKTELLEPMKLVHEMMQSRATMQTAHIAMLMAVWMIGTKMMLQVWATNCPAALQTATANLILLKQQRKASRKMPEKTKQTMPMASYSVVVPPDMVGMLRQVAQVEEIRPALQRKTKPIRAKMMMIPRMEVHTMRPAKHLRVYMKIKEMTMAPPRAARIHFQLLLRSVVKELRSLELRVELKVEVQEQKAPAKTVEDGTQILLIMAEVSQPMIWEVEEGLTEQAPEEVMVTAQVQLAWLQQLSVVNAPPVKQGQLWTQYLLVRSPVVGLQKQAQGQSAAAPVGSPQATPLESVALKILLRFPLAQALDEMTTMATTMAANIPKQMMSLHSLLASLMGPCSMSEQPVSFWVSSFIFQVPIFYSFQKLIWNLI